MDDDSYDLRQDTSIAAVSDEWRSLASQTQAAPFLWPGWVSAWLRSFDGRSVRIFTLWRAGRLVAVVPLKQAAHSLRNLTNAHTPWSGILAEGPADAARLTRAVADADASTLVLRLLVERSPDDVAFTAAARGARRRVARQAVRDSLFTSLQGDWDSFSRGMSKNLRNDVRRRRRRLEEIGQVTFDVVEDCDRRFALDDALRLEASGWKGRAGSAIASAPAVQRFYRDIARWATDEGWFRLAFLRLDGRPLAMQYLLDHAGVRYYVKGGYDEQFGQFSPGKVLMHAVVEDAVRRGLHRFEMLGQREPYKEAWATGSHRIVTIRAVPRTIAGDLDWMIHAGALPAMRTLRRVMRERQRRDGTRGASRRPS